MPQAHRPVVRGACLRRRRGQALAFLAVTIVGAVGPRTVAVAKGPSRPRSIAERGSPERAPEPEKQARPSAAGRVQFVTEKRAYLNRGAHEGLAVGEVVQLFRGGRMVAACTVEQLSDHLSTCMGARARVGDVFRLNGDAADGRGRVLPRLPPLIDGGTLETRAQIVADAPYEKVDFKGTRVLGGRTRATVSPSFTVWVAQSSISQEQLDGQIHVSELGNSQLRFDAAFSAMHWGIASAVDRFRPNRPTQFYLWEAEVSRRRTDGNFVFAVGRIWPWHTPGLTLLDGVQVGRQNDARTIEGGAYAGVIPGALSGAPSLDTWASGVYAALVQQGHVRSIFRLARQEARVGVWRGPSTGLVTEGEVLVQLWLGSWNLGSGGRLRVAPEVTSGPTLERAYLDIGSRPTLAFGGGLHLRYFGAALPDGAILRAEVPTPSGSFHFIADAHFDILPWLGVGGYGGTHRERETGRSQYIGAAEIRFRRLAVSSVSAAGGIEAEEGWLRGRLIYGQVVGRISDWAQILGRATLSATEFSTPTTSPNLHEIGGYLHVDGSIAERLRLRAWSMLRVPFLVLGEPPTEVNVGLAGGVTLTGSF